MSRAADSSKLHLMAGGAYVRQGRKESQMRRALIAANIAGLMMLWGCSKPESDLELTSSYVPPPDASYAYEPATTDDSGWSEYEVASSGPDEVVVYSGGERTHIVQRKETLYSLSRMYYGDNAGWKKIYAANQNRISDPNKISVGMELVIP